MELTKDYIENLKFTVIKNKYYDGKEVDGALDEIAQGVDELCKKIARLQNEPDKASGAQPAAAGAPDVLPQYGVPFGRGAVAAPAVFSHEPAVQSADMEEKLKKMELEKELETLKLERDNYKQQTEKIIRYAAHEVLKLIDKEDEIKL